MPSAAPVKAPPFTLSAEAVRLVAEIAALVERFAIINEKSSTDGTDSHRCQTAGVPLSVSIRVICG